MDHAKRWKAIRIRDEVRTLLSKGHEDIDEAKASAETDLNSLFEKAHIRWPKIENSETSDEYVGDVVVVSQACNISYAVQRYIGHKRGRKI